MGELHPEPGSTSHFDFPGPAADQAPGLLPPRNGADNTARVKIMGRPTKLTEARKKAIVTAITNGNFAQVAAAANGITEQTYYNWLNRGQIEAASDDPELSSSIFAEFFEAIKIAEAKAEVNQLRKMQTGTGWQRHAWWLERRFPKRWGAKQSLEVSGPDGGPIAVAAQEELTAFLDQRREAIAAAEAALAGERSGEAA